MGKVHRIKKAFRRFIAQKPLPQGYHSLGAISVHVGKRWDGSVYLYIFDSTSYGGLKKQLEREYEAGVAREVTHSDKAPVKE